MTATPSPKSTASASPPRKRTWRPSSWRSKSAHTRKSATAFLKASTEKRMAMVASATTYQAPAAVENFKSGWLTPVWEMGFINKFRKGDAHKVDVHEDVHHQALQPLGVKACTDANLVEHLHHLTTPAPSANSSTTGGDNLTPSGSTGDSFMHPRTPPNSHPNAPTRPLTPAPTPADLDAVSRPRPAWTLPNGPIPSWIKSVPDDFEEHRWNMAYVVHAVGGLQWHPECGCYSCDSEARAAVDKTPMFFPGREPPRQFP